MTFSTYKTLVIQSFLFVSYLTIVYMFIVRPLEKKWQRTSGIKPAEYKFDIRSTYFLFMVHAVLFSPLFWLLSLSSQNGIYAGYLQSLPLWVQFLAATVLWDTIYYSFHRLMHANKIVWSFHKSHHSPEQLHVLAGFRSNVFSGFIVQGSSILIMNFIGFSAHSSLAFMILYFICTTLGHMDSKLRFGILEKIIVTPHYHLWHHAETSNHRNFAFILPVIDMVFGTFYLPKETPENLGLGTERMPRSLKHHQLVPFYDWKWLKAPRYITKKD